MVKRKFSPFVSPSISISSADEKPVLTPPPTPKKQRTGKHKAPLDQSPPVKHEGAAAQGDGGGGFTPDKRQALIERLIGLGLKACRPDELAAEFGLTVTQLKNATQAGRKGNLRDKAVKAVRGE